MASASFLAMFCCSLTLALVRPVLSLQSSDRQENTTVASQIRFLRALHEDTMKTFERFQPHTQASVNSSILINLTKSVTEVSDQFLSVTIDACAIWENWTIINFTSPSVINMAKGLYPAMLRLGGTPEDFVIFEPDQNGLVKRQGSQSDTTSAVNKSEILVNCYPKKFVNFTMNTAQWDAVNEFVKATGWEFIYGLNVLFRTPDGAWNYSNPEELMRYTASKGYPINWELGNGKYSSYCAYVYPCDHKSKAFTVTIIHNQFYM